MRDYDGKTAAERVAERRRRLVDAGLELFGERGYAATSIRAVLRQAGLQDRYFAESFADLDCLLAAVYDQIIDEEVTLCRAAIDAADSPSAGARAMIDALGRYAQGNPARMRVKLLEAPGGGPVTSRHRQVGQRRLAELVAGLLPRPGRGPDPFPVAIGIVAAANELLLAWLSGEPGFNREQVVTLVAFMFDAVADQMTAEVQRAAQRG
jgi:AcrR family transcriptional regulator